MDRRQLFAAAALAACGAVAPTDPDPAQALRDAVERQLLAHAAGLPPLEAAMLRRHARAIAAAHVGACHPNP